MTVFEPAQHRMMAEQRWYGDFRTGVVGLKSTVYNQRRALVPEGSLWFVVKMKPGAD